MIGPHSIRRRLMLTGALLVGAAAVLAGALPAGATPGVGVPEVASAAVAQTCPADLTAWKTALGAEWIDCHALADLTTTGNTTYTDNFTTTGYGFPPPASGALNSNKTNPTAPAVPGIQVDGYFHDGCNAFQPEPPQLAAFMQTCTPTFVAGNTCLSQCHHDAAFVIRIPDAWNGRLLTAGTGGIRDQFSNDFIFSDFAMEKGWAYVSSDKGNMGANFFQGGCDEKGVTCGAPAWPGATCPETPGAWCPGAAIAEWTFRIRQATSATRHLLKLVGPLYGHPKGVKFSYMTGASNGGYQTRRALETDLPSDPMGVLYDGGVDWEGTLLIPTVPAGVTKASSTTGWIIFNYLPTSLNTAPQNLTGDPAAVAAMTAVGFNPASQPLWPYHYGIYWGLTQKAYRLEFDPEASLYSDCVWPVTVGPCVVPPAAGVPPQDTADANYNYSARLAALPALATRIGRTANTGDIHHPMITLHGDQDALLPIKTDSDLYAQMVHLAGHDSTYRYYVVQGGNHVDAQFDDHSGVDAYGNTVLRPILPCTWASLNAMQAWVEKGVAAPASHTIARDPNATAADLANKCDITAAGAASPSPGISPSPGPAASPTPAGQVTPTHNPNTSSGTLPLLPLLPPLLGLIGLLIAIAGALRPASSKQFPAPPGEE